MKSIPDNEKKEKILRLQSSPRTASSNWDPSEDTEYDVIEKYTYYNLLPFEVRIGLRSFDVAEKNREIAKKYSFEDELRVGELSRMVRQHFFMPINDQDVQKRALDVLEISANETTAFCQDFRKIIELVKKLGKQYFEEVVESVPIIPALKKYPDLKNQEVSKNNLKVFEVDEFVMPTVGNWIDDYINRKGAQAHDNLTRSDFLFNSENGKKLSVDERKKLGAVLDSYDNDLALNIHSENQEILFAGGFRPDRKSSKKDSQKSFVEDTVEKAVVDQSQIEIKPPQPQPQPQPQPEMEVQIPESIQRNNSLESWRNENQGGLEKGEPELAPEKRRQEIGWFGEETKQQKPGTNQMDDFSSQLQPPKVNVNNKNVVTRNYQQVAEQKTNQSGHIIDLKEVG